MNRKSNILAAFLTVMLCVCMLCGCDGGKGNVTDTPSVSQSAADSGNINIPGYEALDFNAGETKQTTRFHNPAENGCLFRMSLTVNEETLWTSDYIAPGENVESITLSHALNAGEYDAKLHYECFTITEKAPLNGADIDLTINVK